MSNRFEIDIELVGLPSGQVIYANYAFIPTLFTYGLILYHDDMYWTFEDDNEYKINKILKNRDICLF